MYKIFPQKTKRKVILLKANIDVEWWYLYFSKKMHIEHLSLQIFRTAIYTVDFELYRRVRPWPLIIFLVKKMTYKKQRKTFFWQYRKIWNRSYTFDGYWKKIKRSKVSLGLNQTFFKNKDIYKHFRHILLDKKEMKQRDIDAREGVWDNCE